MILRYKTDRELRDDLHIVDKKEEEGIVIAKYGFNTPLLAA